MLDTASDCAACWFAIRVSDAERLSTNRKRLLCLSIIMKCRESRKRGSARLRLRRIA